MTRLTEAQVRAHNEGVEAVKSLMKRNKYGAKKIKINGYTFDSKHEGKRYSALKLMLDAGMITELVIHPSFPIYIKGVLVCDVELDFMYRISKEKKIYEDTKGKDTDISRLKRKMVEAEYGIKVDVIK